MMAAETWDLFKLDMRLTSSVTAITFRSEKCQPQCLPADLWILAGRSG
jgi:hypothetical protein